MKFIGVVYLLAAVAGQAAIISVGGNLTSSVSATACASGNTAQIIAAPPDMDNNAATGGAENCAQQGFNEQQGVLLGAALNVDGATDVAAGLVIDSHMIFLNSPASPNAITHDGVVWTFSGIILGVMSDINGTLEAASNGLLGAPGTSYPGGFTSRGLEGADSYVIAGNQLTVNMRVTEPGDWIRVVTLSPAEVPEPGTYALMGAGLLAIGVLRRRRA